MRQRMREMDARVLQLEQENKSLKSRISALERSGKPDDGPRQRERQQQQEQSWRDLQRLAEEARRAPVARAPVAEPRAPTFLL